MRSAMLHGAAALATFTLVLTSAPDAGAAVLTTAAALADNGQIPACVVTNIDTKPITVTVQLFDAFVGKPQTPALNTCPMPPATLAPRNSCAAELPANSQAFCVATSSSSKARAALDLVNGTTFALEVHIPATK